MAEDMQVDLGELTEEERSRLPSRLRARWRDKHTQAWAKAKEARDAAIAKATVTELEEHTDPNGVVYSVPVTRVIDPDAIEAAKAQWQEKKAALLAKQREG